MSTTRTFHVMPTPDVAGHYFIEDNQGALVARVFKRDDVRLLAAAPVMLAQLQAIAGTIHHVYLNGKGTHSETCPPCLARVALVRAAPAAEAET